MDQDLLRAIQTNLTVPVWPTAGMALNYRRKGAAYAAARRGAIHVIRTGRRMVVPTAWLKAVLCLDGDRDGERSKSTTRKRRGRQQRATKRSRGKAEATSATTAV